MFIQSNVHKLQETLIIVIQFYYHQIRKKRALKNRFNQLSELSLALQRNISSVAKALNWVLRRFIIVIIIKFYPPVNEHDKKNGSKDIFLSKSVAFMRH